MQMKGLNSGQPFTCTPSLGTTQSIHLQTITRSSTLKKGPGPGDTEEFLVGIPFIGTEDGTEEFQHRK